MRSQKDRRASTTAVAADKPSDPIFQERRHSHERRMENLSMEERQLQLSEMPSPDLPKPK